MSVHGILRSTRSLVTLLVLISAVAVTLVAGAMVARPDSAEAHTPCYGEVHWHRHVGFWFAHWDYYVPLREYRVGAKLYEVWVIGAEPGEHVEFRHVKCI